ncbi:glycosyltransferase [Variovorax sp. YR216]|uniref:glycosyltransferase n=1 Tax=Variovorax sp. YR216 TaxID=1882828 RepID=UPI00089B75EA|nr:glycosyltransferase [Variovorax sp. YR216]SEA98914.1 Glycosyltransferase involved in cell wall bisynthesis [Variovorax sp. YR216]
MSSPLLEALTASYNSAATLPETLASAWNDNRIPVLLVDDGSTDGSADAAERHEGVRVLRQRNAGPSVARNRAIMESRADFVLFLDSDDLLRPGYREAFETALAANPDADVFICGMQIIDEDGRPVESSPAPSLQPTPFLSVLNAETVPTNGIIVRRELFSRSGLFRPDLHHAEDLDLWLRLAATSDRWVRMDHMLAVYRRRSGSLSRNGPAMWRGVRQVVEAAVRLPVGAPGPRRAAGRRILAAYVNWLYWTAVDLPLRERACASLAGGLRDVAQLPLRFWPMALRYAIAGSFRERLSNG